MAWKISVDIHAVKQLKKLDKTIQRRIVGFLQNRISSCTNPRKFGKPLIGQLSGLWRHRVSDYRLICSALELMYRGAVT